jgi:NitT/TauT family transport system substrate-binding protein/putative hydroxymethylpyrimidine transport system substrate-binding protein
VTGVPSDGAVLDTVVRSAGGDPGRVQTVTIGFNGVQDLENDKIAAFTGYWPADGTQVQTDGFPITTFELDDHGGPAYPGLVLFSTRGRLGADPPLARAMVAATVRGYEDTLADPERSLQDLLGQNPSIQRPLADAFLP